MSADAAALDLRPASSVSPWVRTLGLGSPAGRTRALFAAAYGVMIATEAFIGFTSSYPAELRGYYLWRALYWAFVDVASWWTCVAAADAVTGTGDLRPKPYVLAAAAASLAAPLLHHLTGTWYFEPPPLGREAMPALPAWWMIVIVGAWRMTLLTAAHYHRLRTLADAALLQRAQLDRATLSRKAIEARLRALQGKVEPGLLFATLDDIERLCESEPARADRILECLIAFLRGALPQADDRASTIAGEMALAGAYLALVQARADRPVDYLVESEAARDAIIAPMLLPPLIEVASRGVARAGGTVAVACNVSGDRLRVVASVRSAEANSTWAESDAVAAIAERLEELHGETASLDVRHPSTGEMQITLEMPLERAARGDR